MVQELIPKERVKASSIINKLFLLSLILLIILGGVYAFLKYKNHSIQSKIKDAENQIVKINSEKDSGTEKYIFDAQKKISDFSKVFKNHKIASNFLAFINESSNKEVKFLELNFNTKTNNVSLRGETENFDTLGKQILNLQKSDLVKGLDMSNISLNKEGKVDFTIIFSLDSKIFKSK